MTDDDVLDEALTRLHATGPEFGGYLSNHGPMAADALVRIGRADAVERWVDAYLPRLYDAPTPRWTLREADAVEAFGAHDRLADWCALFDRLLQDEPWTQVLTRWWPRLLPSAVTAAAHPLIRTGHVVRALREDETAPRRRELAQALGYWAARWQPQPAGAGAGRPLLLDLPLAPSDGTFTERLDALAPTPSYDVDLDDLVDEAVEGYLTWGADSPIMLVHAATAPRAAALVLPSLPPELWAATRGRAWSVAATIVTAYRTGQQAPAPTLARDVADRAVASGDEHAIKFVEVALESAARGSCAALAAAGLACDLLA